MATLLSLVFRLVVLMALTFAFVVLLEHGPAGFVDNAKAEWGVFQASAQNHFQRDSGFQVEPLPAASSPGSVEPGTPPPAAAPAPPAAAAPAAAPADPTGLRTSPPLGSPGLQPPPALGTPTLQPPPMGTPAPSSPTPPVQTSSGNAAWDLMQKRSKDLSNAVNNP